jgi:hypothetical protein
MIEGRIAYTIAAADAGERIADADLRGRPLVKMGVRPEQDFHGAWAWRTLDEAQAWLDRFQPVLGCRGAVYGLLLPNGWAFDVSDAPGHDGVHRLLVDALLFDVATA